MRTFRPKGRQNRRISAKSAHLASGRGAAPRTLRQCWLRDLRVWTGEAAGRERAGS